MSPIDVILALMIIASFLVAIVIHEFGHALMATWLGDPTPRIEGRLSLSPRSHLEPVGTLLCVILAFFPVVVGPAGIGWGKSVKSDPWKLRGGPNLGTLVVALAGPLTSLIVGLLFAFLLRFLPATLFDNNIAVRIPQLILVFASVNICLAIFNIIPLYPLDGYQIVYTLLPSRQAVQFAKSAPYGPLIILAIFFLLPFLASLSRLPLPNISQLILTGSLDIISLVTGSVPRFFNDIAQLYFFIS